MRALTLLLFALSLRVYASSGVSDWIWTRVRKCRSDANPRPRSMSECLSEDWSDLDSSHWCLVSRGRRSKRIVVFGAGEVRDLSPAGSRDQRLWYSIITPQSICCWGRQLWDLACLCAFEGPGSSGSVGVCLDRIKDYINNALRAQGLAG